MSRCTHRWSNTPVTARGIEVSVLTCLSCGRRLVQTYHNGKDQIWLDAKPRRTEAAHEVRKRLADR